MTTASLLEDTQTLINLLNAMMSTDRQTIIVAEQTITELINDHFERFCLVLLDNIIIPAAVDSK